jgi:LEA14-like dessication related protein
MTHPFPGTGGSSLSAGWRSNLRRTTLIILLAGLMSACRGIRIREPQFLGLRDVRTPSLGLRESRLSATLDYINPNRFSLGLEALELDVRVFDTPLGRAGLSTPIRIPARDTFSIPVSLEVDMRKLLANAVTLGFNREWDIRLEGRVVFRKGPLRLQMPIRQLTRQRVR